MTPGNLGEEPQKAYPIPRHNYKETLQDAIRRCLIWVLPSVLYLTNRFHVALRLFSNTSQMTPRCGTNENVPAQEEIAECFTDVASYLTPAC